MIKKSKETCVIRKPWPDNFPNVIIHSKLEIRDNHPCYHAAKAGDASAAISLVQDLLNDDAMALLQQIISEKNVIIAGVAAIEKTGFNAIPDAMQHEIGQRLEICVDKEILQTNKVAHTRSTGWHRLVTPPLFGGDVEKGMNYVLVDDHVGFGGTLANMRGYIEANGGKVIAMTTLTQTVGASKISPTQNTINMLRLNHGKELEIFWQETFGYSFDCLTDVEGGYVARQSSFDVIRKRLVKAAEKASRNDIQAILI